MKNERYVRDIHLPQDHYILAVELSLTTTCCVPSTGRGLREFPLQTFTAVYCCEQGVIPSEVTKVLADRGLGELRVDVLGNTVNLAGVLYMGL